MMRLSLKMMTHHFVMTSSLRIKNFKIHKFGDFSIEIGLNTKMDIFRDVISLIINQCDPRRLKGASGRHKVSASSAAQASEARLYIYMRASLVCAAGLGDTLCLPEAPFGRLWSPLIYYRGNNISKYVCPTIIIDITRKITIFINFKFFDE